MKKWIQAGLVLVVFLVPLVFSRQTTEIYGLIKSVTLEFFSLGLLILWLIQVLCLEPRVHILPSPLYLPVFSVLAVSGLSLINATNIHLGLSSLYLLLGFLSFFFLLLNHIEKTSQIQQIMGAAVLAGLASCGYSILQNKGINLGATRFAYVSTFGNPIFFSQYLVAVIPLSLAMCFRAGPQARFLSGNSPKTGFFFWMSRIFFGLVALLMLFFLLLTRSLAAYLGLLVAILVMGIYLVSQRNLKRILIWVVVIGFTLSLAGAFFSPILRAKLSSRRLHGLMRIYVWQSTLRMISEHPILGVGAGNFRVTYPLYRSPQEKKVTWKGVIYFSAHNDFLQIWAEGGTLGLICFLWMVWVLLRLGWRLVKTIDVQRKILSAGLLASIVAILVVAFFNPALQIPTTGMCFWVFAGLIARLEGLKSDDAGGTI